MPCRYGPVLPPEFTARSDGSEPRLALRVASGGKTRCDKNPSAVGECKSLMGRELSRFGWGLGWAQTVRFYLVFGDSMQFANDKSVGVSSPAVCQSLAVFRALRQERATKLWGFVAAVGVSHNPRQNSIARESSSEMQLKRNIDAEHAMTKLDRTNAGDPLNRESGVLSTSRRLARRIEIARLSEGESRHRVATAILCLCYTGSKSD